jgi:quercetin dioxygenase-like cupin family protein
MLNRRDLSSAAHAMRTPFVRPADLPTMPLMTHRYTSWEALPLEQMSDVISRKIFSGDKAMVAQVFFKKGGVVPLHSHENEQITYILEGALKFELEGAEVTVHKGEVLHIPSNVPHRAVALEDTLDLDIFSPPRADWLQKDDEYLRRGEQEHLD